MVVLSGMTLWCFAWVRADNVAAIATVALAVVVGVSSVGFVLDASARGRQVELGRHALTLAVAISIPMSWAMRAALALPALVSSAFLVSWWPHVCSAPSAVYEHDQLSS
jgi:hypothetical protein